MKVLVACEESQTVTKAFRERGHEAYSCDILPESGGHPEWHISGDVLPLIDGDCTFTTVDGIEHNVIGQFDILIACPPCTYLSNAGACRLYPKKGQLDMARYKKGLEGKEFFLKFLNAKCDKICVENPVSSKVFEMPPHTQTIQPYEYGHAVTKKTRLWLKGLPNLVPTNIVEPTEPYLPAGTSRKDVTKYGRANRTGKDAVQRAKFFVGVAEAMATQWG